ncbi:MAG: glycosyltransferase [Bacteroidia bacterium]
MRFLIGCTEVCGLIRTYADQLKAQGHDVITISDKHAFFDYKYTFSFSNISYEYFESLGVFKKLFLRYSEHKEKKDPDYRKRLILRSLMGSFDVYFFIWNGLINMQELFKTLKKANKKIIVFFLGDDVRYFPAFSQQYDVSNWTFPKEYTNRPLFQQLMKLRTAEKYADLIYSVPDQMGLAQRSYDHLWIPIDITRFTFKNNKRKVPKVIHLPSEPYMKGSDVIMRTLSELKEEGLQFEMEFKSKIPHEEVKSLLVEADILVDEIVFHGPGVLAFEAMASGCAVATNHYTEYSSIFNPPLCSINKDNIKGKLRELIDNYDLRQTLIEKGIEFVRTNNNPSKIVNDILSNLENRKQNGEYSPNFYTKHYVKNTNENAIFNEINKILEFD